MLLVTMTKVLIQEEYFAFRYFNPKLSGGKKQNIHSEKAILKVLTESFLPKNVHGYHATAQLNYNGNEP